MYITLIIYRILNATLYQNVLPQVSVKLVIKSLDKNMETKI